MGSKGDTWISMTIGDLVTLNYGESLPERKRKQGKIPVYGSNGITGYHDQALVPGPGIIVGRKGTSGAVHYCKFDYFPIDTTFYITPSENYDLRFVYYLLKTLELDKLNFDSAVPGLNRNTAYSIPIKIPQKQEQQKIASILGALDDKIELNHEMNRTLEEMAQAIFKHWFVDFEFPDENGKPYKSSGGEMVYSKELDKDIPKGWKVGTFSELVEYRKDTLKPGNHLRNRKYVPIELLPKRKMGIDSYKEHSDAKSSLIGFEKDDILFGAMRPYFHRVNIAPFSGITRTTVFVLRPKDKNLLSYALFYLNLDSSIDYATSHSIGSTIPYAVWNNSLEIMPTIIPFKEVLTKFNNLIYPIICEIRDGLFENLTLSQLRDTLLPKLLSGEIRVQVNNGTNVEVKE